jgi:hypothetical protein
VSGTVLYMSMSLDGYIADLNENPARLHEWIFPGAEDDDFEAAVKRTFRNLGLAGWCDDPGP